MRRRPARIGSDGTRLYRMLEVTPNRLIRPICVIRLRPSDIRVTLCRAAVDGYSGRSASSRGGSPDIRVTLCRVTPCRRQIRPVRVVARALIFGPFRPIRPICVVAADAAGVSVPSRRRVDPTRPAPAADDRAAGRGGFPPQAPSLAIRAADFLPPQCAAAALGHCRPTLCLSPAPGLWRAG